MTYLWPCSYRPQLTGALSHVLPIMICVMTSKWVGDYMGKDGIYSVWIAMRRYPWLPPVDYRDRGETGANIMKPLSQVIVIEDGVTTVAELTALLAKYQYHGFPIIDKHGEFVGYATRQELTSVLGKVSCIRNQNSVPNICIQTSCNSMTVILTNKRYAPFPKTVCECRRRNESTYPVLSRIQ